MFKKGCKGCKGVHKREKSKFSQLNYCYTEEFLAPFLDNLYSFIKFSRIPIEKEFIHKECLQDICKIAKRYVRGVCEIAKRYVPDIARLQKDICEML